MDRDPLDAHLTEDEVSLLERCHVLARDVLQPVAATGTPGRLNRVLVKALSEHGLLDRLYEPAGEGRWNAGVSAIDLCLVREGLARGSTEAETAFALQGLGSFPLLQAGRPEVVGSWIARLAAGDAVAAFALTEPEAGTDVASMSLAARRDGDGFRLTGEKIWISNAPDADVYSVFARTTEGAGARGITAFMVPRETDGLTGEALTLLSPHPIGRLVFDEVYVPAEHVLGDVDRGFAVAMQTLDLFRPSVGAFAIGMARAALDVAARYVTERQAFGKPLSAQQAIGHRLAELTARTHAARLLVHQAARAYDAGLRPMSHVAAMGKLLATELAQEAVDAAIQFHGARALEHGHLLEHLYRDVRAPRIYEGASEIQREIIARHLFKSVVAGAGDR
jgi:alkylation response protein AidB-like acyl-CoA dehydrogenase